jgi:tRNA(Met) C34 N-acetyltransferase TmcA
MTSRADHIVTKNLLPRGSVLARRHAHYFMTRLINSTGSTLRQLAISMNSSTSTRRSPASIFQTNESLRLSFAANSRCVRSAASRASTIAAMTARCLKLLSRKERLQNRGDS